MTNQQPSWQPGWQQPAAVQPPAKKRSPWKLIGGITAGVLVLCCGGFTALGALVDGPEQKKAAGAVAGTLEPVVGPVASDAGTEPVAAGTSSSAGPSPSETAGSPQTGSTTRTPEARTTVTPAANEPTTTPATGNPTTRPTTRKPSTKPTTSKPSTKPATPKPTTKKPDPDPEPEPTFEEPEPEPETVYYKNCTAVRKAGAAPIYRGEPGYGRHLDRDGDGVGCE
ncbi:excalibur calcium-binding domain-containing protein [Actinoplanes missouriensis]|uniref:excalibur calcium-binding domain-containing protein n=1 Tax=Actinoplanes missouriensis TaxID=1866 RepID=UPI0033C7A4BA